MPTDRRPIAGAVRTAIVLLVAYALLVPVAMHYARVPGHRLGWLWRPGPVPAAPTAPMMPGAILAAPFDEHRALAIRTSKGIEVALLASGARYTAIATSPTAPNAAALTWTVTSSTSGIFAPSARHTTQHITVTGGGFSPEELVELRREYAAEIARVYAGSPQPRDPRALAALVVGDGSSSSLILGGWVINIGAILLALVISTSVVVLIPRGVGALGGVLERRRRRPQPYGRCPRCNYDISNTPFRCPECGEWPDFNAARPRPAPTLDQSSLPPTFPGAW